MNLCLQAKLNIILSIFSWVAYHGINYKNKPEYCLSENSCDYSEKILLFSFEVLLLVVSTLIINWLCKINYNVLAWILVFVPFVLGILSIAFLNAIVATNPDIVSNK